MAQDASEVVVGADGAFYTAPYSAATSLPENIATAIPGAFNEHGFLSEDGVTFRDGKEVEGIPAWQSFYDLRKVISAKSSGIECVLRQFNPDNAMLAFGGGDVDVTGGVAIYTPPTPEEIAEVHAVVEWEDGDYTFRLVLPRAMASDDVESELVRTAALDLPLTLEATPAGKPVAGDPSTFPFYIVSDHPAWANWS